ncbi:sporulation integral membrane protein YlbJ [Mahella sp.]|uniref:sporulation integral membrane protein YlbJ n=1 Tax=Mahella sp. TaxID=2798721 RepID=UPI0025C087DD|nr:sporulation integral membrane protein YlbJ [Mahella sp.]MBZ4666705.1 sporulation integral rane protein YlbJ [Mahella sp.]
MRWEATAHSAPPYRGWSLLRQFLMKKAAGAYILAISASLLVFAILLFPQQSFEASLQGVHIWFEIVFPSLLPFFIGTEILISIGVVNFVGVILEPVMRPLFNTPGCSSFAYIMSITSGYPTGARITARLRQQGMVSKAEGERMLAFCSTSGPLFISGAVAVGMLGYPSAGWILLTSHYLASITAGLIFRFYKRKETHIDTNSKPSHLLSRAISELYNTYMQNKEPLGQMLNRAVSSSVLSLLSICGFIVLFSVLINILDLTGILDIAALVTDDSAVAKPFLAGLIEMTIGSRMLSQLRLPLWDKLPLISFIIAWGGLSVHAQVAAVTSISGLSLTPYIFAKIIQAITAALYASIFTNIIQPAYQPAFSDAQSWLTIAAHSGRLFIIGVIAVLTISIAIALLNHIKIIKL